MASRAEERERLRRHCEEAQARGRRHWECSTSVVAKLIDGPVRAGRARLEFRS